MSFRVETTPNHYTDFEIYSANRLNQLGKQFLSLINPNYGTNSTKKEPPPPPPPTTTTTTTTETENPPPPPATTTEPEPIPPNVLQQPSDLCRPRQDQHAYYLADPKVLNEIKENFLPHQSILPYIASSVTTLENDEQFTASINDWQTTKSTSDFSRNLPSQIITIVQCRSTLTSTPYASSSSSQRNLRHAVRLFINAQQQQQQMNTFLDTINEALLLEPDTIKTLWDSKGQQILDPTDVLRRGRLYFASRDEHITLDELYISDADLASINRLETVRSRLSQPAYFVEKPVTNQHVHVPSRKSTPCNEDNRRSATVQAQAIAYNDPQTFPEVFLRHYSVGDVLGDGRFSAVFECRDKATGIQLALKIIDKARCQGYEYLIENELAILRRVKHPNIIKLVEEFQNESKYFLVLEYVSNGDLLTAVTTMNKYSEHDVALMLSQIVSALKYLHSLQIIHRDVKLENILITNYPDQSVSLKLADFGLALCLTDESPIIAAHGDNLCGTPMYIAPEVIQSRDYRLANDMWSVGIIAFTLLSGMAPFNGENDDEILSNVMNKTIDFGLLPKLSFECRDALILMLERDPNRRITAAELLQHPWIKREMQRRMDPIGDLPSARRRKKGTTQQQPLLTFSSVEHHPTQTSNIGGHMGDIDEL